MRDQSMQVNDEEESALGKYFGILAAWGCASLLLRLVAYAGFLWFTAKDLGEHGGRHLSKALGIQSNVWVWICILFGLWASFSGAACMAFGIYKEYPNMDRSKFRLFGGKDISFWSGLVSTGATLYIFARFVPIGAASRLRPFLVLIASYLVTGVVATILAKLVCSALFGKPRDHPTP